MVGLCRTLSEPDLVKLCATVDDVAPSNYVFNLYACTLLFSHQSLSKLRIPESKAERGSSSTHGKVEDFFSRLSQPQMHQRANTRYIERAW
jgi:hypothetical protein